VNLQRLTYDKYGDVLKIGKHVAFDGELTLAPWVLILIYSSVSQSKIA